MSFWVGQALKNEAASCKSATDGAVEEAVIYQTQTNEKDHNEIDPKAGPSSTSYEVESVKYKK